MYKKEIFRNLDKKYNSHLYSGLLGYLMNYCHKKLENFKFKNKSFNKILEIGAGTGNLTEYIIKTKPKKIFVIEKDGKLVESLKERFGEQINIINKDILKVSEDLISKEKLIVYGNLPYNISTQILTSWIKINNLNNFCKRFVLMFQKEVAERICEDYGTKKYGILSVFSKAFLSLESYIIRG